MNPRPPVLFFVTDAIRHDHVTPEKMPFLHGLTQAHSHAMRLRPNFGFCERAEFFTGTRPDANGYFAALTLGQGSDFSQWDTALWQLLDWNSSLMRKPIRRAMRGWFHRVRGISQPIYEIPMRLLPHLTLTEDRADFFENRGAFSVETLFDVMSREGRSVFHESFISVRRHTLTEEQRVEKVLRAFAEPRSLYLLYQGIGDVLGHAHGPDSPEVRAMLPRLDAVVEHVITAFQRAHPAGRFVVCGDHGMLPVEHTVDVRSRLRRALKGREHEITHFLDSTLLRMWCATEQALRETLRWISEDETMQTHGQVLTREKCRELHVPAPGGDYGDLYWLANPGVLIFPDFFRRDGPPRGMHGYETHVPEQQSYAIWHHSDAPRREIEEVENIDICPLLCDLLEVVRPLQCQGVSPLNV